MKDLLWRPSQFLYLPFATTYIMSSSIRHFPFFPFALDDNRFFPSASSSKATPMSLTIGFLPMEN
jgi:hypothetical protein